MSKKDVYLMSQIHAARRSCPPKKICLRKATAVEQRRFDKAEVNDDLPKETKFITDIDKDAPAGIRELLKLRPGSYVIFNGDKIVAIPEGK